MQTSRDVTLVILKSENHKLHNILIITFVFRQQAKHILLLDIIDHLLINWRHWFCLT